MPEQSTHKNKLTLFLHWLRSGFIIITFLALGKLLTLTIGWSIPGSVVGLILLFIVLSLRLIPLSWVQPSGHFLLQYMTLFFIPAGVGLLGYIDLIFTYWLVLLLSCLGSTLLVMITISVGYQRLNK